MGLGRAASYYEERQDLMIKLDQFLKLMGAVSTGGEAKFRIQEGHVKVNGEQELRRGRKLTLGDIVDLEGKSFRVEIE
jgi:ribosome-associated protein